MILFHLTQGFTSIYIHDLLLSFVVEPHSVTMETYNLDSDQAGSESHSHVKYIPWHKPDVLVQGSVCGRARRTA